jgi:predicted  nucleic acid-binding Zn-ribbon protein
MYLLSGPLANNTEPESEVHSDEDLKAQLEERLNERSEEIASLQELVRLQGDAISELRKTQADTKSSACQSRDNGAIPADDEFKSYDWSFDLGSTGNMWSDDEDDSSDRGTGIRASIEAIRQEASKVDAVMALNKLDTLQEEQNSLTRAMKNRTAEMDEMRALIRLKDDRLATLELERDLYKADASKLKSDLQTCSERIKSYESHSLSEASLAGTPLSEPIKPAASFESPSVVPTPSQKCDSSIVHQARIEPDHEGSSRDRSVTTGSVRASRTDPTVISDMSSCGAYSQNLPRRDKIVRPKKRNFLPFRNKVDSRRTVQSSTLPTIELTGISLQKQVDEMNERLLASMKASEELRKRLAMISRYYENLVRRLQDNMVELKSDRVRMETDLVNQISSIDLASQMAIEALETELKKKGSDIEELKAQFWASYIVRRD